MKPTRNALLEALHKFGRAVAKRPPGEEWYTLQELSQQEDGLSVPALKYRIATAKKRGVRVEMAPGTQLDDEGNARKAIYYRLKNGKP